MEMSCSVGTFDVGSRRPSVCHISTVLARVLYRRGILLETSDARQAGQRRLVRDGVEANLTASPTRASGASPDAGRLPATVVRRSGPVAGLLSIGRAESCREGYSRAVGRAANGPAC